METAVINLSETIPEFAIKHLIEWCRLPPSSGSRGGGRLIEMNPGSSRVGRFRESGLATPR